MGCSPSKKKEEGEKSTDQHQYHQQEQPDLSLNPSKPRQSLDLSSLVDNTSRGKINQMEKDPPTTPISGKGNVTYTEEHVMKLGPLLIFRPRQLKVVAGFPREDGLLSSLQSGVGQLGWNFRWMKMNNGTGCGTSGCNNTNTQIVLDSTNQNQIIWKDLADQLLTLMTSKHFNAPIDFLFLDFRQVKLLPNESLDVINTFEKSELISSYLDSGIDHVAVDHGITSPVYWTNELTQLERSLVESAYKLETSEVVITALDHCRDLVQITDSQNRIQFINEAYEKLLGFSGLDILGTDFLDVQHKAEQAWSSRQSPIPASTSTENPNRSITPTQQLPPVPPGGIVTTPASRPSDASSISPSNPYPPSALSPHSSICGILSNQVHPIPGIGSHDLVLDEISQGKQWEGSYLVNKKSGEPIYLHSRILPFPFTRSLRSRSLQDPLPVVGIEQQSDTNKTIVCRPPESKRPHHIIYICELASAYRKKSLSNELTQDAGNFNPMPRGSLKSLRKASYDIKSISNDSSILRRQSLAKLHSLTIEAPITKVINIITAAQQNCPIYISQSLEKVLEILRTTELYSPQFFEGNRIRTDDPLTTDLLGALLSQGPKPPSTVRRSSNENTSSRLAPRPSLPDIAEAPGRLQRLLETESRWDFDIILLEEISERRPLVWTGMSIFVRFGVAQSLNTDETTLRNWLTLIEANYHTTNAYHTSTHAADVLQATSYFLSTERLKTFLEPMDEVVSLIAAVVHDVDHPGKTSGFLSNSGNELSLLYNDLSVLESHHAAFAFKLTLSDPRVNIFKNLDSETYRCVRRSIIDMVLATEMTKHFEHLSKFVNVFTKPLLKDDSMDCGQMLETTNLATSCTPDPNSSPAITPTEPDISTLLTPDNIILVKRMLIKCADVSNPTRPLKLCTTWAKRIAEEYFRQTEEELARGLPPVMPMFERETCSIPKSQTGFVDYFVADMFEAWDAFLDLPEVIEHMKYNYNFWKDLDRQGIHSAGQVEAQIRQLNLETYQYLQM